MVKFIKIENFKQEYRLARKAAEKLGVLKEQVTFKEAWVYNKYVKETKKIKKVLTVRCWVNRIARDIDILEWL